MNLRTIRAYQAVRLRRDSGRRRGSTLIIVIVLLASLMLLGFLFLTIASQEQASAFNFAEAAKVPQAGASGGAGYFDPFLEQLILGARDDYYNSALWGGRNSLLPTMFGNDLQPYNGEGVNLTWFDPDGAGPEAGYAVVDQEFDGSATQNFTNVLFDAYPYDDDLASINLSPAAWLAPGGATFPPHDILAETAGATPANGYTTYGFLNLPAADVDYTRPDLASPFLAYVAYEPTTGQKIVIPSFHRPQYLRDMESMLGIGPAVPPLPPAANWSTNPDFARRTLRPHQSHVAVTAAGADSGWPRFVTAGAGDADESELGGFPFHTKLDGTTARSEGVWRNLPTVDYEADPDNDGTGEAVYIDLGLPPEVSADGTKTTVPLVAFTVYDADALFNPNAHGNLYGDIAMDSGAFGDTGPQGDGTATDGAVEAGVVGGVAKNDYISRSSTGLGPHQVNLGVGLDQATAPAAPVMPFGHVPVSPVELANMELWFLKAGRAEIDASNNITSLYTGQYGEDSRLRAGTEALLAGGAGAATAPKLFSYPGGSGIDDEIPTGATTGGDMFAGAGSSPANLFDVTTRVFPNTVVRPPFQHPLDVRGQGRYVTRTAGGKERWFQIPPGAQFRLPYYADYAVRGSFIATMPNWRDHLTGDVLVNSPPWGALYSDAGDSRRDHPNETWLSTRSGGSQDLIFAPGESATLQFADGTDQDVISFSQRLLTLAPENFGQGKTGAQDRRRMFSTYSADVKTHSGSPAHPTAVASRPWEQTTGDPLAAGYAAFPPFFAGTIAPQTQPFRQEVRGLLRDAPNQIDGQTLMRKLSVNQVASSSQVSGVMAGNERIRLRPLMPHPQSLSSAAVPSLTPGLPFGAPDSNIPVSAKTWSITTPQQQEWHARRDRQNLARDIYVLLYTLGGVSGVDPTTQAGSLVHPDPDTTTTPNTNERLREMAQFAANLVDAMDEDDTVTCFVYDTNLADGYTDLDDGYANPVVWDATAEDYIDPTTNRGMVFGVEAQSLALSEGLIAVAQRSLDGSGNAEDHPLTEWSDEFTRDFSFVELINNSPQAVSFNENWQIVLRPDTTELPSAVARSLVLTDQAAPVDPNSVYAIAAAGDNHNWVRMNATDAFPPPSEVYWDPLPSRMRINIDELRNAPSPFPAPTVLEDDHWKTVVPPTDKPDAQNGILLDLLKGGTAVANNYKIYEVTGDAQKPYLDGSEVQASQSASLKSGEWLVLSTEADPTTRDEFFDTLASGTVKVELRRRLNLNRDPVNPTVPTEAQDNPWITVDTMDVELSMFNPSSQDNPAFVKLAADKLVSRDRDNPLAKSSGQLTTPQAGPPFVASNSIGDFSPDMLANQTLWQPHFDRPFASLGEVMGVPVYGPNRLTDRLGSSIGVLARHNVAASRVLFPDGDTADTSGVLGLYNNLWYRAFEYLAVPEADGGYQNYTGSTPADPWFAIDGGFPVVNETVRQQASDVTGPYQRFGKININTLRHPHVYAGMLDDFSVMGRPQGEMPPGGSGVWGPNPTWNMASVSGENLDDGTTQRQWWTSFLASRDGFDPQTGLILPGLAVGRRMNPTLATSPVTGRPFRSTAMALRAESGSPTVFGDDPADLQRSLDDTIFRRLPMSYDASTGNLIAGVNARGLFELGGANEPDTAVFDYSTRYRLLSKVLNHSTTRSNVFLVFIDVKYFNAKVKYLTAGDESTKYVRIGAPDATANANSPRGFFVIDRSKAMELIKETDLPQNNQYPNPATGTPIITSSFARNPDGTPTFDWKSLVLSSTRIR